MLYLECTRFYQLTVGQRDKIFGALDPDPKFWSWFIDFTAVGPLLDGPGGKSLKPDRGRIRRIRPIRLTVLTGLCGHLDVSRILNCSSNSNLVRKACCQRTRLSITEYTRLGKPIFSTPKCIRFLMSYQSGIEVDCDLSVHRVPWWCGPRTPAFIFLTTPVSDVNFCLTLIFKGAAVTMSQYNSDIRRSFLFTAGVSKPPFLSGCHWLMNEPIPSVGSSRHSLN